MGFRITGISFPFGGLQWERRRIDRDTARDLLSYLADRRVLFNPIYAESEPHCVESANRIREFLTNKLTAAKPGKDLHNALTMMRAACRRFVDQADATGRFRRDSHGPVDSFALALGDLRATVGMYVAALAFAYDIEVEPQLVPILPPQPADGDDRPNILGLGYY